MKCAFIDLGKHFGGAENYLLVLIERWVAAGNEAVVLTKKKSKFEQAIMDSQIKAEIHGVDFSYSDIKRTRKLLLREKIDVIDVNGINSGLFAVLMNLPIRRVTTVHSNADVDRADKPRLVRKAFVALEKSCMAGFALKNTLSDNGGVTRGICKMDENGNLTEVVETKNIVKTAGGAEADGVVVDVNSLVSMNMWGLTLDFLDVLEDGFKEFFEKEVPDNPLKAEYLIPIFIGELLEQGKMSVKVLKTNDTWYGMTYHEDVAAVKDSFKKMLENGVYKAGLFSDL